MVLPWAAALVSVQDMAAADPHPVSASDQDQSMQQAAAAAALAALAALAS